MQTRDKSVKIYIFSWFLAIIFLVLTVFLYRKVFNSNQLLEAKISKQYLEIGKTKVLIEREATIKSAYRRFQDSKTEINNDILKYIENQVSKHGLNLVDLRKDKDSDLEIERYNLRLSGKFEQFIAFNYGLYELDALLSLSSYEIKKKDESSLDIKVVLEYYVL